MSSDTNFRLRTQTKEEQALTTSHDTEHRHAGVEFASADEMLRYDAAQTQVPPVVTERLKDSVAVEPPPARSWWRRWFGG
jgi:hypothetical protein